MNYPPATAMPPEDVSHRDIYVRLAELGAKIDSILAIGPQVAKPAGLQELTP